MKITKKTLHTLFFLVVIIALVWCIVKIYGNGEEEPAPDLFDEVLVRHAEQTACVASGGRFISYKLDGFIKTICEPNGNGMPNHP